MSKKKQTEKVESGPLNVSFETFHYNLYLDRQHISEKKPSCFNSEVSVKKYRVTVTEIVETNEVIAERLRKLWRESDNHHHTSPLQSAARKIGIELDFKEWGKDNKRK